MREVREPLADTASQYKPEVASQEVTTSAAFTIHKYSEPQSLRLKWLIMLSRSIDSVSLHTTLVTLIGVVYSYQHLLESLFI